MSEANATDYPPGWHMLHPLVRLAVRMWAGNDDTVLRVLLFSVFETDHGRRMSDRAIAKALGTVTDKTVTDTRERFVKCLVGSCAAQGIDPHEIIDPRRYAPEVAEAAKQ